MCFLYFTNARHSTFYVKKNLAVLLCYIFNIIVYPRIVYLKALILSRRHRDSRGILDIQIFKQIMSTKVIYKNCIIERS